MMQLHRTSGQPDWAPVPAAQRNSWQRLAAGSHGIVTPGNACTLLGFGLVVAGLVLFGRHHYWAGLWFMVAGRLGDVLDGLVADATGTKGPVGEFLDVVADKLEAGGAVVVLYLAHAASWWALLLLLLPQLVITGVKLLLAMHWPLHPSALGKVSTALSWLCLFGFGLAAALSRNRQLAPVFDCLALAAAILGLVAAYGYVRTARTK